MIDDETIVRIVFYFVLISVVVFLLDEYSYHQWKKNNPGTMFSLITEKGPLNPYRESMEYNDIPNGFRPGGGIQRCC